jgi:hypothetical protein
MFPHVISPTITLLQVVRRHVRTSWRTKGDNPLQHTLPKNEQKFKLKHSAAAAAAAATNDFLFGSNGNMDG